MNSEQDPINCANVEMTKSSNEGGGAIHRIAEVRASRTRSTQEETPVLGFMLVEPPQRSETHM
jgi:hypothetical protein